MNNEFALAKQSDILEVIANLSNDTVFTPPRIVNEILDCLPEEVWKDTTLRWLDPCSKTGVFPREITRRLMVGLSEAIPDEKTRLNHILNEMVFAIATEEVTALMSRRSLYCSKDASSKFSVVPFKDRSGNVWHKRVEHSFDKTGSCSECRGKRFELEIDGRDNKAYGFIHSDGFKKVMKEMNMKFDVIVGNPPYQMETGSASRQAVPLYHIFVRAAIQLNPKHVAMIIPSRWFAGGLGLDDFRSEMLKDERLRKIVDYLDARECFPGVDIAGGVCYFLWSRDTHGLCEVETRWSDKKWHSMRKLNEFDVFVRTEPSVEVLRKVSQLGEKSIVSQISGVRPFGIPTYERPDMRGSLKLLSSGGSGPLVANRVVSGHEMIPMWKVITSKASHDHGGQPDKDGKRRVLSKTELLPPDWACTESYIVLGCFKSKKLAENYLSYIKTNFVRFLISLRSFSQDITRDRFAFVPIQDFTKSWTDADLIAKYDLQPEQVTYIQSVIKAMPE